MNQTTSRSKSRPNKRRQNELVTREDFDDAGRDFETALDHGKGLVYPGLRSTLVAKCDAILNASRLQIVTGLLNVCAVGLAIRDP